MRRPPLYSPLGLDGVVFNPKFALFPPGRSPGSRLRAATQTGLSMYPHSPVITPKHRYQRLPSGGHLNHLWNQGSDAKRFT